MAITVYTTPNCSWCTKVKKYLKEQHIPFKEYDVAKDKRRAEEMVRKSKQMGTPVVDVHGKIIVGFNQPEIEKALRR